MNQEDISTIFDKTVWSAVYAKILPPSLREVARRSRDGGSAVSQDRTRPQSFCCAKIQPPQNDNVIKLRDIVIPRPVSTLVVGISSLSIRRRLPHK